MVPKYTHLSTLQIPYPVDALRTIESRGLAADVLVACC